jgi:hypothetical protein
MKNLRLRPRRFKFARLAVSLVRTCVAMAAVDLPDQAIAGNTAEAHVVHLE